MCGYETAVSSPCPQTFGRRTLSQLALPRLGHRQHGSGLATLPWFLHMSKDVFKKRRIYLFRFTLEPLAVVVGVITPPASSSCCPARLLPPPLPRSLALMVTISHAADARRPVMLPADAGRRFVSPFTSLIPWFWTMASKHTLSSHNFPPYM